jgi:diguanylate cyclase (GGDEF)-like protein
LVVVALVRVLSDAAAPVDWLLLILVATCGIAALVHAAAARDLDDRRRGALESFARILSALSRSVSADAIVDAIVEDLGHATAADHIVVVRRLPDRHVLEARLVSSRPGVPDSTTRLPMADLEDPVDIDGRPGGALDRADVTGAGRVIAERIAARVRTVYGLTNPLAAPLIVHGSAVGAIVVTRRADGSWPETTRRILDSAAHEASAALARAYSHRSAEEQATTDALTGLPNRRYFDEIVSLLPGRRRAGDAVGILMVDIDRFKVLNDTHGHATGDEVLRAVAGAIVAGVREEDVPARFGGEEFVVLLRNPDPDVAVDVGERIRSAVRGLDLRTYGVRGVSVSVGVAVAEGPDESIEALIATADRALYRAKRAGRDRVVAA